MLKQISTVFVVLLILMAIAKWDLISYLWMQGKGQWKVISEARPIEEFLENPDVPDSIKYKLLLVNDIKSYAAEYLGMPASDQYNKMYDQQGKDVMWVVTASLPYELESYEWKFPFLGKVEYKGFFVEEEAQKLEVELRSKGYDTRIRTAAAWSTLGWLNDPILSKMLENTEGKLAELIIHELTHDVVFIKDSVDFNENLATFIGTKGAISFLKHHFPADSSYLLRYEQWLADKTRLNNFIREWLPEFKKTYEQIRELSTVEKEQIKYNTFERFKQELRSVDFSDPDYARGILENPDFNNAYLLSYRRYTGTQAILEEEFEQKYQSDISKMLEYYKDNFKSL